MKRLLAYLWASPTTLFGLLFYPFAAIGGTVRLVDGVIEMHGPFIRFVLRRCTGLKGGASAMTLGHVVIGRSQKDLDRSRVHERVHVRQYERWGPFFVPAYFGASAYAWLRGRRAYLDNPFEREAFETAS